jgi:hypothetical protein
MILLMSAASLVTGTMLSCAVDRFPKQHIAVERYSGMMLVAGLALIGSGLPLFR